MQSKIGSRWGCFTNVLYRWKSSKLPEYSIQQMISDWLSPSPSKSLMCTCTATMHRKNPMEQSSIHNLSDQEEIKVCC